MAKYKLGDIAPIRQGVGPDKYPCWLLNLDMVESNTGRIIEYLYVQSDEIGASTVSFDTRNVLYSKLRPYLNKVVLPEHPGFATSEMLTLMPDTTIITREYLTHFLRSSHFVGYINEKTSGAKMPRANTADLKAVEIDCPSIEQQNAIVGVFEHLTRLIELRQHQLCILDTLVKARFVEMFGLYPDNPMGWRTGVIRDVVSDVRYGSSRPAVEGGQYPYLRMNNITYDGELDLTDTKRIDVPENELDKCTVRRGDVLFNRTNSKELVGKTCVYDRDEMMVLAGFVIRVRLNDTMLPEFLSAFLNTDFSKQMLLGMCKAAIGQANINAQEMQGIGLYIPHIERQREFVSFKAQVDKSKAVVQAALDEAQLLFDSLMQQYFG